MEQALEHTEITVKDEDNKVLSHKPAASKPKGRPPGKKAPVQPLPEQEREKPKYIPKISVHEAKRADDPVEIIEEEESEIRRQIELPYPTIRENDELNEGMEISEEELAKVIFAAQQAANRPVYSLDARESLQGGDLPQEHIEAAKSQIPLAIVTVKELEASLFNQYLAGFTIGVFSGLAVNVAVEILRKKLNF